MEKTDNKYRALLENLNEVVYALDETARIVYISPNVEKLGGYTPSELMGRLFTEFVHPDDLQERMRQFQKILSGVNEATEYRFLTKKGHAVWVRTSARPTFREGQAIGLQGVLMDITERKLAEKKMEHLSLHDSLTGLYNRHFLQEEMKKLETSKTELPISIIMADLNGLKLVNDTCGHDVGDGMLRRTAHLLRKSCRRKDRIARWGGDEFVILLPQTTLEEAKGVSQRIHQYSGETDKESLPISVAVGAATKNSISENLVDTLKSAESDMYTQKLAKYQGTRNSILKYLLKTLAEKGLETETDIRDMQNIAMKMGEKLGLPNSELDRLAALVLLHDVGMINIPTEIVTKNRALSAEEEKIMQKHPEIGCRIARATEVYAHVAEEVLAHHEHWNGSGYPQGLKGRSIPLLARIVALVDAYGAMTGGRPYKEAISARAALAELKRCAGTKFDPQLVEIFSSVWEANPHLFFDS